MKELCSFFKVLSDETRCQIFTLLLSREMCVCEIVSELKLSQSLISHHLHHLKVADLVKDRRDGVWIHYSINQEKLNEFKLKFLQGLQKASSIQIPCKFACCEAEVATGAKRPS